MKFNSKFNTRQSTVKGALMLAICLGLSACGTGTQEENLSNVVEVPQTLLPLEKSSSSATDSSVAQNTSKTSLVEGQNGLQILPSNAGNLIPDMQGRCRKFITDETIFTHQSETIYPTPEIICDNRIYTIQPVPNHKPLPLPCPVKRLGEIYAPGEYCGGRVVEPLPLPMPTMPKHQ